MLADDAAGLLLIRSVKERLNNSPELLLIEGGAAPENFTGNIRRFGADYVLIVDASDMGKTVGTIEWLDVSQADGFSASSHIMPLSILARYLNESIGCQVGIIGIQAGNLEMGNPVSREVVKSIKILSEEILKIVKKKNSSD